MLGILGAGAGSLLAMIATAVLHLGGYTAVTASGLGPLLGAVLLILWARGGFSGIRRLQANTQAVDQAQHESEIATIEHETARETAQHQARLDELRSLAEAKRVAHELEIYTKLREEALAGIAALKQQNADRLDRIRLALDMQQKQQLSEQVAKALIDQLVTRSGCRKRRYLSKILKNHRSGL